MSNLQAEPNQTHFNYFSATQMQQERAEPVDPEIQSINFGQSNSLVQGVVPYPSNIPIIVQENRQINEIAEIVYTPTYPFPNPEVIFSEILTTIRYRSDLASKVIYGARERTKSNELLIALHQIYSDQLLNFNGIHFFGNSNVLNPSFFQDYILSPLFESNHLIPTETIKKGQLIVTSSMLMEKIQAPSRSQLICSSVGLVLVFVGYIILQSIVSTRRKSYFFIPYLILFAFHAVQYVLFFIGLRKFKLNYLRISNKLTFPCLIISLFALPAGLFLFVDLTPEFIGVHATIIVYILINDTIGTAKVKFALIFMRRHAILFKQIPKEKIKIEENCC